MSSNILNIEPSVELKEREEKHNSVLSSAPSTTGNLHSSSEKHSKRTVKKSQRGAPKNVGGQSRAKPRPKFKRVIKDRIPKNRRREPSESSVNRSEVSIVIAPDDQPPPVAPPQYTELFTSYSTAPQTTSIFSRLLPYQVVFYQDLVHDMLHKVSFPFRMWSFLGEYTEKEPYNFNAPEKLMNAILIKSRSVYKPDQPLASYFAISKLVEDNLNNTVYKIPTLADTIQLQPDEQQRWEITPHILRCISMYCYNDVMENYAKEERTIYHESNFYYYLFVFFAAVMSFILNLFIIYQQFFVWDLSKIQEWFSTATSLGHNRLFVAILLSLSSLTWLLFVRSYSAKRSYNLRQSYKTY